MFRPLASSSALSLCRYNQRKREAAAARRAAHGGAWPRAALALGTHALALSAPLAHAAGAARYRSYRLVQPFEGGAAHVALQAIGWGLYACALAASLAVLRSAAAALAAPLPAGAFAALGALGVAAHACVDASVALYVYDARGVIDDHDDHQEPASVELEGHKIQEERAQDSDATSAEAAENSSRAPGGTPAAADGRAAAGAAANDEALSISRSLWFSRTRLGRLGAVLQASSAALLVLAALLARPPTAAAVVGLPDAFVRSLAAASGAGTALAACVAHGALGRGVLGVRGYRLWAPFEGGCAFVCLQAVGWALLTVHHIALICVLPLGGFGGGDRGTVLLAAVGVGSAAVLALMASVGHFDGRETRHVRALARRARALRQGPPRARARPVLSTTSATSSADASTSATPRSAPLPPASLSTAFAQAPTRAWCGESAVASCLLVASSAMASLLLLCRQRQDEGGGAAQGAVASSVKVALHRAHGIVGIGDLGCAGGADAGARAALRLVPMLALAMSYEWALRIACAAIHLAGPIAHFGGTRLHPPGVYRFYQPFKGGSAFVIAQTLGWCMYGVSALASLVTLSKSSSHAGGEVALDGQEVAALFPLAFLAQATLLASVPYFDPGATGADGVFRKNASTEEDEDDVRNANALEHAPSRVRDVDARWRSSTEMPRARAQRAPRAAHAPTHARTRAPRRLRPRARNDLGVGAQPAPSGTLLSRWTADSMFALVLSCLAAVTVGGASAARLLPERLRAPLLAVAPDANLEAARAPLVAAAMAAYALALGVGVALGGTPEQRSICWMSKRRVLQQCFGFSLAVLAMIGQLVLLHNDGMAGIAGTAAGHTNEAFSVGSSAMVAAQSRSEAACLGLAFVQLLANWFVIASIATADSDVLERAAAKEAREAQARAQRLLRLCSAVARENATAALEEPVEQGERVARGGARIEATASVARALRQAAAVRSMRERPQLVSLLEALASDVTQSSDAATNSTTIAPARSTSLQQAGAMGLSAAAAAATPGDPSQHQRHNRAQLRRGTSLAVATGAVLLALLADAVQWDTRAHTTVASRVGPAVLSSTGAARVLLLGCATVAGSVAIVMVHFWAGRARHGDEWRGIPPFEGGRHFVLLQAAGWSCVSSALVLAIVDIFVTGRADTTGVATIYGLLTMAGHRALADSLDVYHHQPAGQGALPPTGPILNPPRRRAASQRDGGDSTRSVRTTGSGACGVLALLWDTACMGVRQTPLGSVVASASLMLFAVADAMLLMDARASGAARGAPPSPHLLPALVCASVAMLGSGPLGMMAREGTAARGATGGARLLYDGAPALQVFGGLLWSSATVLLLTLVGHAAVVTTDGAHGDAEAARSLKDGLGAFAISADSEHAHADYPPPGVFTLCALAGLAGQVAIAAAVGVDRALTPMQRFRRHVLRSLGLRVCTACGSGTRLGACSWAVEAEHDGSGAPDDAPRPAPGPGPGLPARSVLAARAHNASARACPLLALPAEVLHRICAEVAGTPTAVTCGGDEPEDWTDDAGGVSAGASAALQCAADVASLSLVCRRAAALTRVPMTAARGAEGRRREAERDAQARARAQARVLAWVLPGVMRPLVMH